MNRNIFIILFILILLFSCARLIYEDNYIVSYISYTDSVKDGFYTVYICNVYYNTHFYIHDKPYDFYFYTLNKYSVGDVLQLIKVKNK